MRRIQERIEKITDEIEDDNTEVPDGLLERVADGQANEPLVSWDRVVWDIANDNDISI